MITLTTELIVIQIKNKKHLRIINIILLLFILNVLLVSPANALINADEHRRVWNICLGINDKPSVANTKSCFDEFSKAIDNVEKLQKELKKKYDITFKHRLLMHWGFNLNDPYRHGPLREHIKKKLEGVENREAREEAIFDRIKNHWVKKSRALIRKTERTFSLSIKSNSLATIIYDIHIIADYTDEDIDPLPDLKFLVEKDLIRHGIQKLFNGTIQKNASNETIKKIKLILRKPSSTVLYLKNNYSEDIAQIFTPRKRSKLDDLMPAQRQAMEILIILKQDLPVLFGKSFQTTLSNKEITISYEESITEKATGLLNKWWGKRGTFHK